MKKTKKRRRNLWKLTGNDVSLSPGEKCSVGGNERDYEIVVEDGLTKCDGAEVTVTIPDYSNKKETSGKRKKNAPDMEELCTNASLRPCFFCAKNRHSPCLPDFLGICYFIWLAVIVLLLMIVIVVLRKKKEEKETEDAAQ